MKHRGGDEPPRRQESQESSGLADTLDATLKQRWARSSSSALGSTTLKSLATLASWRFTLSGHRLATKAKRALKRVPRDSFRESVLLAAGATLCDLSKGEMPSVGHG